MLKRKGFARYFLVALGVQFLVVAPLCGFLFPPLFNYLVVCYGLPGYLLLMPFMSRNSTELGWEVLACPIVGVVLYSLLYAMFMRYFWKRAG
jgi:hypothetical protein